MLFSQSSGLLAESEGILCLAFGRVSPASLDGGEAQAVTVVVEAVAGTKTWPCICRGWPLMVANART